MSDLPKLPAGIYRHYKGPLYLVLGYGHDSNYAGRNVVVYVGLQFDEAKAGPRLAVRTAEDFFDIVHPASGLRCAFPDECSVAALPRFVYVGAEYTP